jgi:ornithine decarboxylase
MTFDDLHYLLKESINNFLDSNDLSNPTLLFSNHLLKENIKYFLNCLVVDKLYFPVKTNNQLEVLECLKKTGVNFEIASLGELQLLMGMDTQPDTIIFGNPIKIEDHIKIAIQAGINTFSVDTESELLRIANHIQNANIYLRLDVSNSGAEWDLSDKFGCDVQESVILFRKAIALSMNPVGISFHVGWNNSNTDTWKQAVITAYQTIKQCKNANISLKFINIGGGFPAHLNEQYQDLNAIAEVINPCLSQIKKEFNMEVYAEPGSFLTANTGVVVANVIDVVKRKDKLWAYLNTGINQGFSWIMGGLEYAIFSPKTNTFPLKEYTVCGPTCDSHDVFGHHILLSNTLNQGDLLLIYPAGAYISSAKTYNGFDYPIFKIIV